MIDGDPLAAPMDVLVVIMAPFLTREKRPPSDRSGDRSSG